VSVRGSGRLLAVVLIAWIGAALAAPHVPTDDAVVVGTVPVRDDSLARELTALRRAAEEDPGDWRAGVALARRHLGLGRAGGDPRHYGYAAAAVAGWDEDPAPPPAMRIVRARILAHRHRLEAAAAELEAALDTDPGNATAWLDLAQVRQASGDAAGALAACRRVERLAPGLLAATCTGAARSLSGRAREGFAHIAGALRREATASDAARSWALAALGDIALRLGKADEGRALLEAGLGATPRDGELLWRLADHHLASENHEAAAALLARETERDDLLVRLAVAEAALGHPRAAAHRAILAERLAQSRRRGEPQLGSEARYRLDLLSEPGPAALLALAHFREERTPDSALLALRAASAAGRPTPAEVVGWVDALGLEDVRIARVRAAGAER
jgi:tetratricopeptide (TPR) repeat protein